MLLELQNKSQHPASQKTRRLNLQLHPTKTISTIPTLIWCKSQISTVRKKLAKHSSRVRHNLSQSVIRIRAKYRELGYQEGLRLAQIDAAQLVTACSKYTEKIEQQYPEAVLKAATKLAEQILLQELPKNPETYRNWFDQTYALLPKNTELSLHYSPTLKDLVPTLFMQPFSIDLVEDNSLASGEISLISPFGQIQFTWRDSLLALSQLSDSGVSNA